MSETEDGRLACSLGGENLSSRPNLHLWDGTRPAQFDSQDADSTLGAVRDAGRNTGYYRLE